MGDVYRSQGDALAPATDRTVLPHSEPRELAPRGDRRLFFGDFELIAASGELSRRDRESGLMPVKLQPQPARLLLYLAERPGVLVTREELQRCLWGDDHFVDFEQGLNYCVRNVRIALGDDAGSPGFIETVPRRGYRFVGEVEFSASSRWGTNRAGPRPPSDSPVGLVVGTALGLAVLWALFRD